MNIIVAAFTVSEKSINTIKQDSDYKIIMCVGTKFRLSVVLTVIGSYDGLGICLTSLS